MPCQPDKYAGPSYPKREKQPGDVRQQDASSAREKIRLDPRPACRVPKTR